MSDRYTAEELWAAVRASEGKGTAKRGRFTAEQIRGEIGKSLAFHYQECGCQWCAKLRRLIAQAADTEEKMERIASADPALVAKVWDRIEVGGDSVACVLRALAAVLKGEK